MSVVVVTITKNKISVSPDGEHVTAVKPVLLRTSKACHLEPLALLQNGKTTCGECHFSRITKC